MLNMRIKIGSVFLHIFVIVILSFMLSGTYANAENNKRLIFSACEKGDIQTVKRLLNEGISINVRDNRKNTLLLKIAHTDHIDLIKFLIKKGIEIDATAPKTRVSSESRTALMKACAADKLENVKLLVENGADIDKENPHFETALTISINQDNREIIKYLLEKGADVNKRFRDEDTSFTIACRHGNLTIAKLLLEYDPGIRSQEDVLAKALYNARFVKNVDEMFSFLLGLGANIDYSHGRLGWNALISVTANKRSEVVQFLLDKGASVDATDNSGTSALLHAAEDGLYEIMRILLKYGANPNHKNLKGDTALTLAKDSKVIEILVSHGAQNPIPKTLANFDILHSLPYDKRLVKGLELAFKQYIVLLTKSPGQIVDIKVTSSKIDSQRYKITFTIGLGKSSEEYNITLSNKAKDINKNLEKLEQTLKMFSEKHSEDRIFIKQNVQEYKKVNGEIKELISHFDYVDIFKALDKIDKKITSRKVGPEILLSASEIYSWMAFFKNTNSDKALSDSLSERAVAYYLLGCLGETSKSSEDFCKGLLLLSLDYQGAAENMLYSDSDSEAILKAYIKYDFEELRLAMQNTSTNKRLINYLIARAYESSNQYNIAQEYYEPITSNYPGFLFAKEYAVTNGSVGFSRYMITVYIEDLIEKHLEVIDLFGQTDWVEKDDNLDRLSMKEVSEDKKLEKWLKVHKALVDNTRKLKTTTRLFDSDFLNNFLEKDMRNALLIYYHLEADRLARGSGVTEIIDIVNSVYPGSELGLVMMLSNENNSSKMGNLLRKIKLNSSEKITLKTALDSDLTPYSQRHALLRAYNEKVNPDMTGLYELYKFNKNIFNRPVAVKCLEEGIAANPYNYLFYEEIFNYSEGKDYLKLGNEKIGEMYGYLISSGEYNFKNGQNKEAISCYRRAINNSPSQKTAYEKLGEIYKENKEFEKAIQTWGEYLEYDGTSLSAVHIKNQIGKTLIEMGEFSRAYDIFLESKDSWQAGALLGFAEASEKTGKPIQAEEYFKKAADRYTSGSCPSSLALFYMRQGKDEMAIRIFRKYKRYQPWHSYLHHLAKNYPDEKDVERVLNIVKGVEKEVSDKSKFELYVRELGYGYTYFKNYDAAVALLEPLALKGDSIGYISRYFSYCKESDKYNPEKILSSYIKKYRSKTIMYWNLANNCLRSGLFDEAFPLLMKLIDKKGSSSPKFNPLLHVSLCWKMTNGDQKNKEKIKSYMDRYSNNKWLIACISFLIGEMDEETILKQAQTAKQRAEVYYYLGVMKYLQGKKEDTLKYLLIYLEVMDGTYIPYGHATELAKELSQQ